MEVIMGYSNNPINTIIPKCDNPEKPNCDNLGERIHILIEPDDTEKEYYMCNKCYESWIMG
jgi:hypothetical protein|tara:strand:- start:326 stop:508 length:183 start_codon:yes stop_codon:yes gene_type:complete